MHVVEDLQSACEYLMDQGVPLERLVVVEEAPDYPGELIFQVVDSHQAVFYSQYRDWLSCYSVLSEIFNLTPFIKQLTEDGWEVILAPNTKVILADHRRWSEPLYVPGYDLHGFQQFSLNRAFERDYWFFNWATGAGKSFVSAAGAKYLLDQDLIDHVIACTLPKSKIDLLDFFLSAGLDAVINDGTKDQRLAGYAEAHQAYVMNYEKLWVDEGPILDLIHGTRVLWVFDETHKLVTDNDLKRNKARRAFEGHLRMCRPGTKIWPMSASVVNGNPLRFRDVFSLGTKRRFDNPLGTVLEFENRYASKIKKIPLKTRTNKRFEITEYEWNETRLQEIRHRVGSYTQTARKTDPGLKEYFKGMQTIIVPIHASPEEHRVYDAIIERARKAYDNDESLNPYYSLLRQVCNTPEALRASSSPVAAEILDQFSPTFFKKLPTTKVDRLNEMLESIREAQDKALVFTHWTTLGLHLIKDKIEVPHVNHYGVGQSDKESQRVKDQFKTDPDITCFFTSDAGAYGLNMQVARLCLQLEPTYSYDEGMQRASRIDRSDSHLDGLTNYVFITQDSVEERVWAINNGRRLISAAVQGTTEVQSYESATGQPWTEEERMRAKRSEAENLRWLIFG